jgi:hypothetical protein
VLEVWEVGSGRGNPLGGEEGKGVTNTYNEGGEKGGIERLDQGHLYPLGERRDEHVTGRARTSCTA